MRIANLSGRLVLIAGGRSTIEGIGELSHRFAAT